jgi:hypothetical protein
VQTNRTGATLPVTTGKAMELHIALGTKPAKEPRDPLPVTAKDIHEIAGVYQNGGQRIETSAKDGRLFVKRGLGPEVELVKRGDHSFDAGGAEFTMVSGADGLIEYVHSGLRSFARVR